ncbi:hypothetical protein ACF05W_32665 [Streptomyces lydicus]|uniref:hypothetical protein n=1 Tax=Streptomyces lydicus TaxID=47763 RepID=UPI0036F8836D
MDREQGQEWVAARELFEALVDHADPDAHAAVVVPWLRRAEANYRSKLLKAADRLCRPAVDGPTVWRQEMLWELYALSRVSDMLLCAFQPPSDTMGDEPWDAGDYWPSLTMDQYRELFMSLGMVTFEETAVFDPFLHEIVDVEQSEDPDEPVEVTEVVWPGLRLGTLLFSRSGVRVRAGVRHAERGVADRSPLYWTFRRRHRPTVDQSLGWGHNSQWRTDFRLDYHLKAGRKIHVDGSTDTDNIDRELDLAGGLLTPSERVELLRNRCLLRTPVKAEVLATIPSWPWDLYPFDWQLPTSEVAPGS